MQVLRLHSKGPTVRQWQLFLIGQGLLAGEADGVFGTNTEKATIAFQKRRKLKPDGEAGNMTIGAAMQLGFKVLGDEDDAQTGINWPPPPNFQPLVGTLARQQLFGKFRFVAAPTRDNPENIKVLDNWASQHIGIAHLPAVGSPVPAKIEFHKLAIPQVEQLWQDWQQAGLLGHVRTWDGSYVPRFIRGSRTQLSNHAFGTAFDINAAFNRLGTIPARLGQPGSVRDMVELANKNGFYWGGHFGGSRTDGMHFEIAKLL
ncbi:M15 family metallopeptidase [Hymenobacter negativus]|uniref:M15 family metallopeptidase n=1 Tax=Hymenobacter negativus TaxID=2795026 RepID=A0ABS3QDC2_9BACT|nr:M15 family metallopeptidase [Hymenobacter negativus]MBO2009245.1 M15 family metallopeptidase [Hymenobacter negativus]